MRILFSCPSSHPALRWLAHGFIGLGHEVEFYTSFGMPSDQKTPRYLPKFLAQELKRRRLPSNLTKRYVKNVTPIHDAIRVIAERKNILWLNLAIHDHMTHLVQSRVMKKIKKYGPPDLVVATGSMNAQLAEYCYSHDIPLAIYLPQPVMGLVKKLDPSQAKKMLPQEKINAAELLAATFFLASSTFIAESLRDAGLSQPIIRHPLGFDLGKETAGVHYKTDKNGPFKIIYVGRAGEQKGIPHLFRGIREISKTEEVSLTVVSRDVGKMQDLAEMNHIDKITTVLPAMHRSQLFELFRNHDVLILPSIFEGYGLVVVEALANGLPVIATPLTAGSDLGISGKAGTIIQAGSSEAISSSIKELIDNPKLLETYSENALNLTKNLGWENYAESTAKAFQLLLEDSSLENIDLGKVSIL